MTILVFLLALPLLFTLLYLLVTWVVSYPYYLQMSPRYPFKKDANGIETIIEAVAYLQGCHLEGWELVEKAQKLVAAKMEYSRRNSWDTPEQAFRRGMGYCLQQAEALRLILEQLNIPSELVQSSKNLFPPKKIHEYETEGGLCGHAWLEVTLGAEKKYVCPGNLQNQPGKIHFQILGRVTPYRGFFKFLGHCGSALLNTYWDRQALARLSRP